MKSPNIIIATVWKNPLDLVKIDSMIQAGANILRVKFGHLAVEESVAVLKALQDFIKDKGYKTEVLLDMPEGKIRLGALTTLKEKVEIGKEYILRSAEQSNTIEEFIPVQTDNFSKLFSVGDYVWIGDGELQFKVIKIVSEKEAVVSFSTSGMLNQFRGVFAKKFFENFDNLSPVLSTLKSLGEVRPECIALSFVDGPEYIARVRTEIKTLFGDSWNPKILSKIESQAGLDNLEAIAKASDILVVARGDLALTTDFAELILHQKRMCKLGNELGVPVVVATQILDSCINSALPSRADLGDFTNIILDGASGIWFSQATAHNPNPGYAINVAKNIIDLVSKKY